ncbi:hypothetical protein BJV82DRAFT_581706 [Fennellomyces sp. T-0311]|nr:hypothetical protein BJV82DRAFT_581706 [Fennellomyces sp. T-0311]
MNNLLTNVEQNPLVVLMQSFSTVTSSLQYLANEVSSLHTDVSSMETTVSTLKQEISIISTRIRAVEHEVVEMKSKYNTISANTEVPAITGIVAVKPFKDIAFSRNYAHPKYDNGSTRQFPWMLYRQLGKKIMVPGAQLLMVNAWGNTKESATNNDNGTSNEVPEVSCGEVSEVPEVPANNENESIKIIVNRGIALSFSINALIYFVVASYSLLIKLLRMIILLAKQIGLNSEYYGHGTIVKRFLRDNIYNILYIPVATAFLNVIAK